MKPESKYLEHLASQLGVDESQVYEALVQNEAAYGVTSASVSIILFWIFVGAMRFFMKKKKEDGWQSSWEFGIVFAGVAGVVSLVFAANGVHHIMSPEAHALKEIYEIVTQGAWDYGD